MQHVVHHLSAPSTGVNERGQVSPPDCDDCKEILDVLGHVQIGRDVYNDPEETPGLSSQRYVSHVDFELHKCLHLVPFFSCFTSVVLTYVVSCLDTGT